MKITRNQFVTREKLQLARELRRRMTPQEKILWHALRKGALDTLHFRRQQVVAGYIVDFYCASAKVAIEIDGDSHLHRTEHDEIRDRALSEMGITTLRISNNEVDRDLSEVLKRIAERTSPLTPLPSGEGNQKVTRDHCRGFNASSRSPKGRGGRGER
ncbi:endonuclease domain-containing protein [Candidatus Binatus sp.]|uniref:endonuclease domain-containing protein n=1 Tax=Candidatus Binatus sp. TaxID=2811406 RepID=UPI0032C223BE